MRARVCLTHLSLTPNPPTPAFRYIAELAPKHLRGKLVTVNQVAICTGILLGYCSCKALGSQWRIMLCAGAPLAILLFLSFIFITPFSPRWLMSKGRVDEARKVLTVIRGAGFSKSGDNSAAVDGEIDEIEATLAEARSVSVSAVFALPHVRWSIVVGVTMAFIQQFTGVNAVNTYAPEVLESAGFDASDSTTFAIYIGVSKLVFVIVALALMDKIGRKTLLLTGMSGMGVCVALLSYLLSLPTPVPTWRALLSAVSLFGFMAFFEISAGPVLWLLLSELYPLSIRGVAMSIAATSCWVFTVAINYGFPPASAALGRPGVFGFFAAACVASIIWMCVVVVVGGGGAQEAWFATTHHPPPHTLLAGGSTSPRRGARVWRRLPPCSKRGGRIE